MRDGCLTRLKRFARRVAIGAVVCFVLVAIPWTYFNIKYSRELEDELAKLKAQGMPLSLAEAAPKPVPDDRNAAVLYQRVFNLRFSPGEQADDGGIAGLSKSDLDVVNRYLREPNPELERKTRALLSRPQVQNALRILRDASKRPHCVFPINWEDGMQTVFPHFAKFRDACRLVVAQAQLLCSEGRLPEALEWWEVSLRMADHVAFEPTLIGQLVSYAVRGVTLRSVQRFLSEAQLTPAQTEQFAHYLGQINLYDELARAMSGERAFGLDNYRHLRRGALVAPLGAFDQLVYLKYMQRAVALAALPYPQARGGYQALVEERKRCPNKYTLASMTVPALGRCAVKRDEVLAEINLCRIVLALKAYKYEHGAYPGTLAELQKTLDWTLPEDPFSGKGFVYRRQGAGFKLYSIGENLKDDGGVEKAKGPKAGEHPQDDIVWKCAR